MASASVPLAGRGVRDLLRFLRLVGQLKVSGRRSRRPDRRRRERGAGTGLVAGRPGRERLDRGVPGAGRRAWLGRFREQLARGCARGPRPWSPLLGASDPTGAVGVGSEQGL